MFSVASVLFGWHAGGGFATGNQANQFYIISGTLGPLSALGAMLLMTLTIRQAMIMYNQRGLVSTKQLFESLYHPYEKLEVVFEVYYYIMVLMATSSSIAGAATLIMDMLGLNYIMSILVIGVILLSLTIFGAALIRKASSVMSICILACVLLIFIWGIVVKRAEIAALFSAGFELNALPTAVLKSFQYAGFQCAAIPTMMACCDVLKSKQECAGSMWISFAMNLAAICLSVIMLLGWEPVYTAIERGITIPTLTICKEMGHKVLLWAYYICLLFCFISTAAGAVFGIVAKFEYNEKLSSLIEEVKSRRFWISVAMMVVAMFISVAGLTNIIKYGYGYCGYVGIVIIVIPFLTIGAIKNRCYKKKDEFAVK